MFGNICINIFFNCVYINLLFFSVEVINKIYTKPFYHKFFLYLIKQYIMAKVIKQFYCVQEKKTYLVGQEYTGKRTDLTSQLEQEKKEKVLAPEIKKKPAKK